MDDHRGVGIARRRLGDQHHAAARAGGDRVVVRGAALRAVLHRSTLSVALRPGRSALAQPARRLARRPRVAWPATCRTRSPYSGPNAVPGSTATPSRATPRPAPTRRPARAPGDVGERVERALAATGHGSRPGPSSPREQQVAALLVGARACVSTSSCGPVTAARAALCDRREHAVGRVERRGSAQHRAQRRRRHHVADAPAGHRVGLGERVDADACARPCRAATPC